MERKRVKLREPSSERPGVMSSGVQNLGRGKSNFCSDTGEMEGRMGLAVKRIESSATR